MLPEAAGRGQHFQGRGARANNQSECRIRYRALWKKDNYIYVASLEN